MPSPIRPADREHFSIVRESLSLDRLHVAMVGRDRGQLLDYAAALAVTLSEKDGWHVEKYEPDRLETLIVDLMLNRFDAALQTVSGHRALPSRRPPGCVLFIPEAQAIPRATFQQLVRLSAGTRDHRLRLVALFPGSSQACAERISWMGGQVARWDLDDDPRGASADALFADARARAHTPTIAGKHYRHTARLVAGATVALVMGVLTVTWPTISGISFDLPMNVQAPAQDKPTTALAGTLGPESLPISAPAGHDKVNDADHDAVYSGDQQIGHGTNSGTNSDTNNDTGSVAKTEVVGQ